MRFANLVESLGKIELDSGDILGIRREPDRGRTIALGMGKCLLQQMRAVFFSVVTGLDIKLGNLPVRSFGHRTAGVRCKAQYAQNTVLCHCDPNVLPRVMNQRFGLCRGEFIQNVICKECPYPAFEIGACPNLYRKHSDAWCISNLG